MIKSMLCSSSRRHDILMSADLFHIKKVPCTRGKVFEKIIDNASCKRLQCVKESSTQVNFHRAGPPGFTVRKEKGLALTSTHIKGG
jgi:hypothetical protein